MKKILRVSNLVTLIITIALNYVSSAGLINGRTVADVSDQYHTLFTPADYAFSIWGLIYLMLLGFVIYELSQWNSENAIFLQQVGWWFVLSCFLNCLWIFSWVSGYVGWSVIVMVFMLLALLKIVLNTNMERWDAPLPTIAFRWWPFCIYTGWITVALIANISGWLTKVSWQGFGMSEASWAIFMIIVAGIINWLMIWRRNMREFALVGIWALVAIADANGQAHPGVVWTAIIVAAILFVAVSVHGYQNRATSPFNKLMS